MFRYIPGTRIQCRILNKWILIRWVTSYYFYRVFQFCTQIKRLQIADECDENPTETSAEDTDDTPLGEYIRPRKYCAFGRSWFGFIFPFSFFHFILDEGPLKQFLEEDAKRASNSGTVYSVKRIWLTVHRDESWYIFGFYRTKSHREKAYPDIVSGENRYVLYTGYFFCVAKLVIISLPL